MKSKRNRDIPFTKKSINDAINVLSRLFRPTRAARNATRPRVLEERVPRPRVDNNNNNNNDARPPRVLRPRQQVHTQNYYRGTKVYRMFGEPTRLVEHRGYIYGFDEKEGYYKVKYRDGDTAEYSEAEIETMLHRAERNTNLLQALSTIKHERII